MKIHLRTIWHPRLEERTLEVHRDKLQRPQSRVYWGVIHDLGYPQKYNKLFEEYLPTLNDQIEGGVTTYVFIETLDSYKDYLVGQVTDAVLHRDELENGVKNPLVPDYYARVLREKKDLRISYWIPLSRLEVIRHEIYKQARPPEQYRKFDPRFKKYGGRPYPTICDLTAEDKLRKFLADATKAGPAACIDEIFSATNGYLAVTLRGREYKLRTPRQATIVKTLHEAHRADEAELHQREIFKRSKFFESSRLRDSFRNTDVWNNLIVQGSRKGSYRLNY